MYIKTVILLKNFLFGLINFVNLSTTLFIQRFLTFLFCFHKNRFNVFYSCGQRSYIYVYTYTNSARNELYRLRVVISKYRPSRQTTRKSDKCKIDRQADMQICRQIDGYIRKWVDR